MELKRYRWTPAMLDVPFLFGAASASALTGPALVELLGGLGYAPSAARNLLTRMREIGSLEVRQHGRIAVHRIAASSLARYREIEGTDRRTGWSGAFDAVLYSVPERQRTLRDRLIHSGRAAGYGLLRAGVLIAASDRWERLRLDTAEFAAEAWVHRAAITPSTLDEARTMARRAWDLDGIAGAYRQSAAGFAAAGTTADEWRTLTAWRDAYAASMGAQMQDPHLPPELLPPDWPASAFHEALGDLNTRIGRRLLPFLRERIDLRDSLGLNEYYVAPWVTPPPSA